jgi:hypothetical protein
MMLQFFTMQKSLRKLTEQKIEVWHLSLVRGFLPQKNSHATGYCQLVSLPGQLTEQLKETQEELRKQKYSAERAAQGAKQQQVILKNAQQIQVSLRHKAVCKAFVSDLYLRKAEAFLVWAKLLGPAVVLDITTRALALTQPPTPPFTHTAGRLES